MTNQYRSLVRAPEAEPTSIDVAWMAGIFEGEGHFNGQRRFGHQLFVTQKDPWILVRFQRFLGGSVGGPYTKGYENSMSHDGIYRWWLNGEPAIRATRLFLPFLSPRRREQLDAFLAERKPCWGCSHMPHPAGRCSAVAHFTRAICACTVAATVAA